MAYYGILGSGNNHSSKVITESLLDIFGRDVDHEVYIYGRSPTTSERVVYDFLLDREINFCCVTNGGASKVLKEAAQFVSYVKDGFPEQEIIKEMSANEGTILLLWDEFDEDSMNKIVIAAHEMGVNVRELSNGLTPFIVVDSPGAALPSDDAVPYKEVNEAEETSEVDVEPLTKEELSSMNIGLLRKAALLQGIDVDQSCTKDALVDKLIGSAEEPKVDEPQKYLVIIINPDLSASYHHLDKQKVESIEKIL